MNRPNSRRHRDEIPPSALPGWTASSTIRSFDSRRFQDDFDTTRNRDQIARTEDRHFGLTYELELGGRRPRPSAPIAMRRCWLGPRPAGATGSAMGNISFF